MRPWTWTLAWDSSERSHGALKFVRWLAKTARSDVLRFCTVHVVESTGAADGTAARSCAEGELTADLRRFGLEDVVQAPLFLEGPGAAEALHSWAKSGETDGLILGRGHEGGASWTSLGDIGRRFVQDLPVPTFVVPADYTAPRDAIGPVVAGLRDDASAWIVVGFADWIATLVGAGRIAMHAEPSPAHLPGGVYPPVDPRAYALHHENECTRARADLAEVVHAHAHPDDELVCRPGASPVGVARLAEERDASIVVCEVTTEPRVEHVVLTSVGPQVAAQSHAPTLLVPRDWPRAGDWPWAQPR